MRSSSTALLAAVLFASCGSTVSAPDVTACDPTFGQEVMDRVNAIRADRSLPVLSVDVRLVAAARGHSLDMAEAGFVGHQGSGGSGPAARIDAAGYDWTFYAENVAAGQSTPEAVVDAWMESPGHRANILSPDAAHLGIGYVERSASEYRHYWTLKFGATGGQAEAPPGGCHP